MVRCAFLSRATVLLSLASGAGAFPAETRPGKPENLAPRARITADSEHGDRYLARFVADGVIPPAGSRSADLDKAWCVRGETHRGGAEIAFTWPGEVTVAEVIYYGRTGWYAEECWKGYRLFLDGSESPVLEGILEMGHGPQRLTLPSPRKTAGLRIRFTGSHGGPNPGAAEIEVFPVPVPAGALPPFRPLPPGPPEVFEDVEESPDLLARVREGALGFEELVVIHRREINPSHVYTQHVEGFEPGGGLYVADVRGKGDGLRELVASPLGQVLDCDVSFDGKEVLFSWRRSRDDGYHLFTVRRDGTGLRQVTEGRCHDYNACWLPDGGIAFLSTRNPQFAYCWISPVGVLHRVWPDGSGLERLSANYLNDFTPSVLDDGRIIYGRWEYVDRPAIPIQSLWTIHPDGTGLAGFFGNRVLSPATFIEPRAVPGTNEVLCTLTAHNGPCRGAIGLLDTARGEDAQESIQNLTPEVDIGQVDRGDGNQVRGPYESPFPIEGRHFLVSKRGTILVRSYAGESQAVLLRPRGGMGYYGPMPLRARPAPPAIPSHLAHLGRGQGEGGQGEGGRGEAGWATLVLVDVYLGLEPQVRRGEVKQLCIVEEMGKAVRTDVNRRAFGFQFPVISCGATYAPKKVWGHVPVEDDGSASFQVPAEAPIYFLAIDGQGRAVQRMRSFTHLKAGESRTCIGCHEPRGTAPPAKRPLALDRPPARPVPPEWGGPRGFDYSTVVQPVLDRYCAGCHGGPLPAGKVDLSGDRTDFFNVSYETLARGRQGGRFGWGSPYVSWIPSYNGMEANILQIAPRTWGSPRSAAAELVISGHPDAGGKPRFVMDEASRRRLFLWMDLNVPYYGTSETAYPEAEGCRRMYPAELDRVLADVAGRRCAGCHRDGKIPREVWTRITNPRLNGFLLAPLARSAGGSGACGSAVFAGTEDPDYRAILETFAPVLTLLEKRPRMDMPGARPDRGVDRSCQ